MLLGGACLCIGLPGLVPMLDGAAHAGIKLEDRKLPMKFSWVACQPNCRGWVSAVGIVTADSPRDFDEFARGRQLGGATIVLDSSGGSVNDSIALGRRWRSLGLLTTVGISVLDHTAQGDHATVAPQAYCESMCVFLLLSGSARYVPEGAHVRVHQIWMGDRADDAKVATYTAQDLTIVERDVGRLAKYTFDMGGAGDLLSMSLNVPPWEDLHELSREELRLTNLVTAGTYASVLHYLKAVEAAGTDEGTAVVAKMKQTPVNDFYNKDVQIRADGRVMHKMFVMKVKSPAASKGHGDDYELLAELPGVDAYRPLSEGGCPLVPQK
jgi:hypothetical protein